MTSKMLVPGGICRNLHRLTPENVYSRIDKRNGLTRWVCRVCKNERDAINRRNQRAAGKPGPAGRVRHQVAVKDARLLKRIIADEAEGDMAHKNDERPSAPWNYLRPKPEAQEKLEALNAAIDELDERTRCFNNPDDYSDYDEERPPTVVEAAMLCAGCPVLDLCRGYAVASKDRGVWGGIRVTDNKKLIGLEVKQWQ